MEVQGFNSRVSSEESPGSKPYSSWSLISGFKELRSYWCGFLHGQDGEFGVRFNRFDSGWVEVDRLLELICVLDHDGVAFGKLPGLRVHLTPGGSGAA
eukprot:1361341-Rhodomonas_salina.1